MPQAPGVLALISASEVRRVMGGGQIEVARAATLLGAMLRLKMSSPTNNIGSTAELCLHSWFQLKCIAIYVSIPPSPALGPGLGRLTGSLVVKSSLF